jgi:hypothetical protein
MDYQSELKRLEENEATMSSEFWKPEAGQHKVKALDEISDGEPYVEEGKEPVPRKWLQIRVNNTDHTWSMPIGKTPASTYGQLCKLAASRNNKLQDAEFVVVVVGSGQNKRFTIVA